MHVSLDFAADDGRDPDGSRPADKDNVQVENLVGSSFGDRLSGDGGRNKMAQENSMRCGDGTGDRAIADRFGDTVDVDCETVQHGA
ncbi:hypothetical protein ACQEVF_39305 [Nonomuraea polychroma]|uniref:hypothetical protein n=1 Tax=Nonomuraea polychroma TaxID=46176 RepID=UPI003D9371C7